MKKKYIPLLLIFLFPLLISAQHRVLSIGNLSDAADPAAFIESLREYALAEGEGKTTLLITGDILSRREDPGSPRIAALMAALQDFPAEQVLIIPGDRDWDWRGPSGYDQVRLLEEVAEELPGKKVRFLPEDGCPGPEFIEVDDHLVIMAVNTQWWGHPHGKPYLTSGDCKYTLDLDFFEEFEDIITDARNKNVLIAAHHPVFSQGNYGGRFPVTTHLFPLTKLNDNLVIPLPVLGTAYVAYRKNVGTTKDMSHEPFTAYMQGVNKILSENENLVYISGHEYGMEVLQKDNNFHISTGNPVKKSFIKDNSKSLYEENHRGAIILDYGADGKVTATPLRAEGSTFAMTHEVGMMSGDEEQPLVHNTRFIPVSQVEQSTEEKAGSIYGTYTVKAGPEYDDGKVKRFFMGDHYRDTWAAPVRVPALNLDKKYNGLKPVSIGGGRQTLSLRFEAADGQLYNFRSVNKNMRGLLPPDQQETLLAKLLQDQTSTEQPYGALVADVLQDSLGILHPSPELYILPNDPQLGQFRKRFAHRLGMLEEHPKSPDEEAGRAGFAGAEKVHKTYNMYRRIFDSPEYQLNANEYAKARIFDMFVGDWGRHPDNWKWALYDEGRFKVYYPVARDRDHIFSRWDGFFPSLLDRKWAMPNVEDFNDEAPEVQTLTWAARNLDRFILNELDRQDWLELVQDFKLAMNDELIRTAVQNMPPEVYSISGKEIEDKLIIRQDLIDVMVNDFYDLLAEKVDVIGTNQKETFTVTRNADGTLLVEVQTAWDDTVMQLYSRKFLPDETKEVRLYGLGDDDIFRIEGDARKSIKVRVIPGDGENEVVDDSRVNGMVRQTIVYDRQPDAGLQAGPETKLITNGRDEAFRYEADGFEYDAFRPVPIISYNNADGFRIGFGAQFTRQKYGKPGFHSQHNFGASVSTKGFYKISTEHIWRESLGKFDILLDGFYAVPEKRFYFFGFGNDTEISQELFDEDRYIARNEVFNAGAGLQRRFWKYSALRLLAHYNYYKPRNISQPFREYKGLVPGNEQLRFLTSTLQFELNMLDNTFFPEHGVRLIATAEGGRYLDMKYDEFLLPSASLEAYFSNYWKNPITLGLKAGGSHAMGDVPLYLYPDLGQTSGLKGFRNNRFTGETAVYLNSELRWTFGQVLPVRMGALAFADVGRVYMGGDSPGSWHIGYGPGIFFVPFRKDMTVSMAAGFSKEESPLIVVGIGTLLNR